jgi:predicted ArsR family transcriptional regulator
MAVDRLEAVGDPGLRAALLFVRAAARPVTADELAERQQIHRNVARGRLERLARSGLVEVGFERRSARIGPGAGRPAKTYRTAPELSGIEFPGRHYETLLGLLADELPRVRLREIGVTFGRELARTAGVRPAKQAHEGLERMCGAVRSLGFQATVERIEDDEAVIATPTCPLRPLVVAHPEAVVIDEGMWAGLAEAALTDRHADAITCEATGCLDAHASCRIHLNLKSGR